MTALIHYVSVSVLSSEFCLKYSEKIATKYNTLYHNLKAVFDI